MKSILLRFTPLPYIFVSQMMQSSSSPLFIFELMQFVLHGRIGKDSKDFFAISTLLKAGADLGFSRGGERNFKKKI